MAGTAQAYNLPFDYVPYEVSYANMAMYGAVLPRYKGRSDKEDKGDPSKQDVIKVDDPKNRDKVDKILDAID